MSDERIIPTPAPSDLPTFKILSGGNQVSSAYQVVSVDVYKVFNKIASAKILLLDGDPASQDFLISNSDDFKPGNEIEIKAGYHNDESTIFKGIIIRHGIKSTKNKPSYLSIEAKDKAVKLTVGRKSSFYYDVKDSEIIEELAGNVSLQTDIQSTSVTHKEMVRNYSTDWDFILSRADVNSLLVLTDDNKLIVKKPDTSSSPLFNLGFGANLFEFEAEMDARSQCSSIKSFTWSYTDQDLKESESSAPSFTENGNISSEDLAGVLEAEEISQYHGGSLSDEEIKAWADSKILKSKLAKIRGRAKFQGNADVKPGSMLKLQGAGNRFNGNIFITGVRHQINSDNWETDVQFGFDEKWFYEDADINDKPAAGLVPAISGLQTGVVVDLESDPDGENRVQVKIPVINKDEKGLWARIATLDAGNERGSFFLPEIDDEVIVGFLNDDPRHPVILGMVHSSAKPAPLSASNDNHEKGFVTRSKMKFIFNDDKKNITLETPAGKKIIIDDDAGSVTMLDENNNKIEMSSGGITLESASDITIKASGDVKVEGTNVNNKANAQFKAEGSGGAELSTSAVAVVKGSLVQIN
jgi:Rhs element Vgr protein